MDNINIMLVDDEPNVINAITRLLRPEKYNIIGCTNATDALMQLEQQKDIHLIISDQNMPGMKGHEFLIQTKKTHPDTIRFMLSAYEDFQQVVSGLNDGTIDKYFPKPWDDNKLKQDIKKVFEEKIYTPQNDTSIYYYETNNLSEGKAFHNFLDHFELGICQAADNHGVAILVVSLNNTRDIFVKNTLPNYYILKKEIGENINSFFNNKYYSSIINDLTFAIVMPFRGHINSVVEKINQLFSHIEVTYKINNVEIKPKFIAGISFYPQHGISAEYLLRNALASMYQCREGTNPIAVYESKTQD